MRNAKQGGWMMVLGILLGAGGPVPGQPGPPGPLQRTASVESEPAAMPRELRPLTLEELPPEVARRVEPLLRRPSLRSTGPVETFRCQPATYSWLLENPDMAAQLWRGLGATCADIQRREGGKFAWEDGKGSELTWQTVHRGPDRHLWYAEGKVRPGLLLPALPVKALVAVTHHQVRDGLGRTAVRHQMELVLQTSSRAVALATRILGASAPHLAERYVGEIEMFFAALAWYLDQNPDKAAQLYGQLRR